MHQRRRVLLHMWADQRSHGRHRPVITNANYLETPSFQVEEDWFGYFIHHRSIVRDLGHTFLPVVGPTAHIVSWEQRMRSKYCPAGCPS